MQINRERLRQRLETLAELGRNDAGINRLTYTKEYWNSCDYVMQCMREAGLRIKTNAVGNLIGTYCGQTERKLTVGSHIDSVRNAGMFDGCLGVIAAIEAVQTLREDGIVPQHSIDVAVWAEEEGLVIGGLFGSMAYCGLPHPKKWDSKIKSLGIPVKDIAACRVQEPVDYSIELHIEQGGVLDREKQEIGVVTAIFAIRRYRVVISGTANHAGSTPMYLRDDALVKAAALVARLPELVREIDREMVGTIGRLEVSPGLVNTIPGRVELDLELRAIREETLERAYTRLTDEFADCIASITPTMVQQAYPMDETVRAAIWQAADALELKTMDIASGAAHDTMALAQITRAGMIFVPSVNGVSHSEKEWTNWRDAANGAEVLLHTLLLLDEKSPE